MPMDMRGLVSLGKMGAFLAGSGRFCYGKSSICVEEIMSPFGILFGIGLYVFSTLTQGISTVMKCHVVPESAKA